jgi:hypothetical protein
MSPENPSFLVLARRLQSAAYHHGSIDAGDFSDRKHADVHDRSEAALDALIACVVGISNEAAQWKGNSQENKLIAEEQARRVAQLEKELAAAESAMVMVSFKQGAPDEPLAVLDAVRVVNIGPTPESIVADMMKLPNDGARMTVLKDFCHGCGRPEPRCFCWNDE